MFIFITALLMAAFVIWVMVSDATEDLRRDNPPGYRGEDRR